MNKTDVFISFKNTNPDGSATKERELAEKLHAELSNRGLSCFYSNVTLLKLGETIYKKSIEDALTSARVLIVIADCMEHLTSEWVYYEWDNFHTEILSGNKKSGQIIPYLSNSIPRNSRPFSIRNLQTFSMENDSIGTVADFAYACISSTTPATETPVEPAKKELNIFGTVRNSLYTSDYNEEFRRLKVQADSTLAVDASVLDSVIEKTSETERWVLDLGCAYNFVGNTRFSKYENLRVLSVDINEKCLEYAKANSDPNRFCFEALDAESADFEDKLQSYMDKYGIKSFDVVFMALVVHHLKRPAAVLRKLRKYITNGGYIVLRGSDDGSVIAYEDNGLVKQIVEKCATTVGFSDRYNGRKLYHQLTGSGFKNVKVISMMKDLSGKDFDERQDLFFERFSYRINNFEKIYKNDPQNKSKFDDYQFMKYALDALEEKFTSPDFWYCEYDYIAYAQIKK